MATIQNARDVYLQAESPRLLPVTISNDFTFNGNVTGKVNDVAVATVTDGAGKGKTSYDGTTNYRNDVAPTNAVSSASSPTVVNNNDGSRDITLTWTYTDGAVPADGFIIFYREGTGTVLSTDAGVQLPATARSFRFQGVHQGTAYRAGIAAFRRTEAGLRITSIYQPTSAPDWRVSATTVNITADINGMSSSTLTSRATSGYDIQQKLEANGSVILTGQLMPINTGGLKVGTITWNSTTGALIGGTGIAITEYGIIGAASGVATFTINAATGAATFKGDISGGANIDITGSANFKGSTISGSGVHAAVIANDGGVEQFGVVGYAASVFQSAGVLGDAGTKSNARGLEGRAASASSVGVLAKNSSGVALAVEGSMTIDNTTLVSNLNAERWNGHRVASDDTTTGAKTATFDGTKKPGSTDTINTWLQVTFGNGEVKYIPVWA